LKKLTHSDILQERLTPEESLKADRHPVSLILHNVRSLYNVGSIFRTADSAKAKELILCGYTPHPPRKEIEKTALGAVDSVPWSYFSNIKDAITKVKETGIKVIAVELTDRRRAYNSLRAEEYPLALVLGNEISGIDNDILTLCDDAIEIPMFGVKHSLNVSVAAGIALFEAIRLYRLYMNNT
jgi:tRNA G18 (ribose-2'-O)-methylase SpoU